VLAPFGVGLAIFVMGGALLDIAERTMVLRVSFGAALRRAAGLPCSAWGFASGLTVQGWIDDPAGEANDNGLDVATTRSWPLNK